MRLVLGVEVIPRHRRHAHAADTNLRPMSDPIGREDLGDDAGARSTTSQRTLTPAMSASRAAKDIVPHATGSPRRQNVWSSSGGVMPCILTSSPAKLFAEDLP